MSARIPDSRLAGWGWLVLATLVAVAAYAILWRSGPYNEVDSRAYLIVASDLRQLNLHSLYSRTLGYPVLLVLTGSSEAPTWMLLVVQLTMHATSALLLGYLLERHGATRKAATLLVLLLMTPRYVAVAGYVMTECLAEFLLVAALVGIDLWLTKGTAVWLAVAALAIGWVGITRPTYQLLGPALGAALVLLGFGLAWTRARIVTLVLAGTVLASASAAMVGGYSLFNYVKFDYFGMTPLLGVDLAQQTLPVLERLPDADAPAREILIRMRDDALVKRGSSHTGAAYAGGVISTFQARLGMTEAEASRYLVALNLRLIRTAPLSYLQAVVASAGTLWLPGASPLANGRGRLGQAVWIALDTVVFGLVALEGLVIGGALVNALAARTLRRERTACQVSPAVLCYLLTTAIVVYTVVISSLFAHADTRFRAPVDSLIVFMAVLGGSIWSRKLIPPQLPLA